MAPITIEDVITMKDIPFKTIGGIIMHVMVCTRPDFAYLYDLSKVINPCSKLHAVIATKT
jgi:hypothetical protein